MLLTITSLGYGGCWVQGGLDTKKTEKVLEIPEPFKALIMICIGGLPDEYPTREKRSLGEVIHWRAL